MNRKNLTAAVLAGLAGTAGIVGSAQAVSVNPDGLGQVLIYPYYTVNGGNTTILSVVNTHSLGKAVKVRFLESMNSLEVLDFNLYLSPFDVWAAALFDDAGTPTIVVEDRSCTVPYIYGFGNRGGGLAGGKQAFLTFALLDGGPKTLARTAEGHFEMLEMGALLNTTAGLPTKTGGSAWAATHINGVPPVSFNPATGASGVCAQLVGAWSTSAGGVPGYWLANRTTDLTAPRGGMFGEYGVVNVAAGSLYSSDAIAINDWTRTLFNNAQVPVAIHQNPGNLLPNMNSGSQTNAEVFWSVPRAAATLRVPFGLGTPFTRGVDAVSFTLQRASLMNEYTTQTALLGKTEWVVTFPTKVFYVYTPQSGSATVLRPFDNLWSGVTDKSCDDVTITLWDREERVKEGVSLGPVVSPEPPVTSTPKVELCWETNVIQFNATSAPTAAAPTSILGATRGVAIDNLGLGASFDQGWMRMVFDSNFLGGLTGRPVTGFRVSEFTNTAAAPGVKATYGGLWLHKYTRQCSATNTACTTTAP